MAVLRVFEIMVEVFFFRLPTGVMTRYSGVEEGSPWDLRWSTRQRRPTLGNNRGSPDALFSIFPVAILLGCEPHRKDATSATEVSVFEAERGAL